MYTQIEKINDETSVEKDQLEKIMNTIKKNEDDAICLMKYTRQDDIRIKVG